MKRISLLRIVIFLAFLSVMLFSGWKLFGIRAEYAEGTKTYDAIASQYVTPPAPVPDPQQEEASAPAGPPVVSFDALLAECPDVVAWLYCEGTPINYPVVQGEDNEYYLHRLLNGAYNSSGTIFMEYRNQPDLSDWNTILYGHNMNNDSMFGILPDYMDQSFYDAHPVMYLLTPTQDYEIELISGYVTPADSDTYAIPDTQEERDALLNKAYTSSSFLSGVRAAPEEKLITLSTCVYDYDHARYVLVGVLRELDRDVQEGVAEESGAQE